MLVLMPLVYISAFAAVLDSNTFTNAADVWNGGTFYSSGATKRMEIPSQAVASHTYTYVAEADKSFTLTLDAYKVDTWESDDTMIVTLNGVTVYNSNTVGTAMTFNGAFDSSGVVTVTIQTNTNAAAEKLQIDNVALSQNATYTTNNERPFTLQFTENEIGNMVTFGNTILCKSSVQSSSYKTGTCSEPGAADSNDNIYTLYNKLASDEANSTIFNSSSSDLTIPAGSTVLKAILYWQGGINSGTIDTATGDASLTTMALAMEKARTIKFKVPGAPSYTTVRSEGAKFNWKNSGASYNYYQGAADVTSLVQQSGTYQVANLVTNDGNQDGGTGPYGGWSLMIVYQDLTSGTSQLKNMVIYDGYKLVTADVSQTFSGFYTPISGTVNAKFTMFAAEADVTRHDAITMTQTSSTGTPVTVATDELDSSIKDSNGTSVTTRSPNFANTIGTDIHTWDVGNGVGAKNIIGNSQSSTKVVFDYPGGSDADIYNLGAFSFATDLYQPQVCYIENIFKGTTNISGIGAQVNEDDNLTVRVYIKNTGNDNAEKVQILHQFETSKFPYDPNSANYNNSNPPYETVIPPSYTRTVASDSSGNDLYEYNTTSLISKIKLGVGATSADGGLFYPETSGTPTVAVYEYNATVKVLDTNYSNVYKAAYINVALGIDYSNNPVTMHTCDGSLNSFYGIGSLVIPATGFDARETSIAEADNNRSITTKVVNKPFQLNALSLDTAGAIAPYPIELGTRVYLFPVDSSVCSLSDSDKLATVNSLSHATYVDFGKDDISVPSPAVNLSNALLNAVAGKDRKIALNYVNWKDYESDFSAVHCSVSNTGGSTLKGVPQCMEASGGMCSKYSKNTSNIECIFGPAVALACAGSNSNGETKPGDLPCNGSSYNASNLPDFPYDNEYGCYQCLAQAIGKVTCSTDNFAARPDRLNVTSSHYDYPNLFRSAEDYNSTVHAYVFGSNTDTPDYNVTSANSVITPSAVKYNRNDVIDATMAGTASFTGDFNMSNGLSERSGVVGNEVVGLMFDDVGKIDIHLEDRTWAAVDSDDTVLDCSSDGMYLCGDTNLSFIPHHFDFNTLTLTNNDGNPGAFTYLANEVDKMAGRIETQMRALNKNGNVTQNFTVNPLWENNIIVTPTVTKTTYIYPDANETTIADIAVGFGTGADANGTKTIPWNDTNTSTYLRFNFRRDVNLTVNPFDVNGSELNISLVSNYTDVSNGHTAAITGERNATAAGTTTFVYGRVNPLGVTVYGDAPITANSYMEVYGDGPVTLGGVALSMSKTGNGWWINSLHTVSTYGDANVTVTDAAGHVPANNILFNGVTTYTNFTGVLTPPMEFVSHIKTMPWLWSGVNALPYLDPANPGNLNCLTHPCFNVKIRPTMTNWVGGGSNKGNKSQQTTTTDEKLGEDMLVPRTRQ